MPAPQFSLEMDWTPAAEAEGCRYIFRLTNLGEKAISAFTLSWSGPARVDPRSAIENGILVRRLSNSAEVAPPKDFILSPGETWEFTVRGTSYPLRHWTDGARAAYLTLGGKYVPVLVGICRSTKAEAGEPKLGLDLKGDLAHLKDGIAVVPRPANVSVDGARADLSGFRFMGTPAGGAADLADFGGELSGFSAKASAAIAGFERLTGELFPDETFSGSMVVRLQQDAALDHEAYRIEFGDDVQVYGATALGLFYGLATLGQILRAARLQPQACRFPASGSIEDAPRFKWRGCHIDLARQFYTLGEVRKLGAISAWNKINRYHLHLTEDEAWRYEVEAYPELARIGAYRGAGLPIPPLLGSGEEAYGGFYTKAELKELVRWLGSIGLVAVPEVDVPGHSFAAIQALPYLRDPGENAEYQSVQGFPNNCLNSAVPMTRAFIETVYSELMEIFPGPWIHVGADEVPDEAWGSSPLAKQRLAEIGGHGPHELQADFLKSLHAQIRSAGRITGAWEEGAHGSGIPPEGSYLVAWRSTQVGSELAAKGYDVVMSPGQAYYLDMALSADWWEPGAAWAGTSSVENSYHFDPLHGFAPEHRARMIGVQACIWSEPMSDRRVFHRLVFPRLFAIAETGWTAPAAKDWAGFQAAATFLPVMYEG